MIIETFHDGKVKDLYERFNKKGRQLPVGVTYVNSWVSEDLRTCYQVMESDKKELLTEWIQYWNDLADFQVIPVLTSAQAKEKIYAGRLTLE